MKLNEFLKRYYGSDSDINMRSGYIDRAFRELILPGSFDNIRDYRKTISWNLDKDVYYREASKENNSSELYVTLTTGRITLYITFQNEEEFQEYLRNGLKKHRGYKKETLPFSLSVKYLYFSRKYE